MSRPLRLFYFFCLLCGGASTPACALEKVIFATNWQAEAEHGGFYQALADGTYRAYGLEVTIVPGGPQKNNRLLLAAGKVDFYMGENTLGQISALAEHVPIVTVAALFQKDPLVLMSHPDAGLDRFSDLPQAKAFIGLATLTTVWPWMEKAWGFSRKNVVTYNFNAAPFIADKKSIQQGYVTSEPFAIFREAGFHPNVFLLADHGYEAYSTTIETRRETIETRREVVRRFVEASIIGWKNYLHGDNGAANALIKRDNPDMDDAQLKFSVEQLKNYGIIESGDALKLGIGAMDVTRVTRFYAAMVAAGVAPAGLDLAPGFDVSFVNQGLGVAAPEKDAGATQGQGVK